MAGCHSSYNFHFTQISMVQLYTHHPSIHQFLFPQFDSRKNRTYRLTKYIIIIISLSSNKILFGKKNNLCTAKNLVFKKMQLLSGFSQCLSKVIILKMIISKPKLQYRILEQNLDLQRWNK